MDMIERVIAGEDPEDVLEDMETVKKYFHAGAQGSKKYAKIVAEFFYLNAEHLDIIQILKYLQEVILAHKLGGRKGAALMTGAKMAIHAIERHTVKAKHEIAIAEKKAAEDAKKDKSAKASPAADTYKKAKATRKRQKTTAASSQMTLNFDEPDKPPAKRRRRRRRKVA